MIVMRLQNIFFKLYCSFMHLLFNGALWIYNLMIVIDLPKISIAKNFVHCCEKRYNIFVAFSFMNSTDLEVLCVSHLQRPWIYLWQQKCQEHQRKKGQFFFNSQCALHQLLTLLKLVFLHLLPFLNHNMLSMPLWQWK